MQHKSLAIFVGEKNKRKIANEIKNICHSKLDNSSSIFSFIEESSLQKRLIKSFNEANFVNNLSKVLYVNYTDSYPFNEIQIIHYASICEAILGSVFTTNLNLNQKREKDKLGVLRMSNIISVDLESDIRLLWDLRNNIHLHKAKTSDFKFFKKHVKTKKDIIVSLCNSLESYINQHAP